ncbi:hypothetical protein GS982_01860 [Rhodococcus hoagii]|uniref:Uncharacterized protein n=1 Tax=Rhodococcus hoagii TaxID=43767 RepID=A0A9Q5EZA7_RHOHA|nr:hypothetical protein [Prescottella equi]NKT77343.1 hypothetical protein [Prescottella equi]NKZ81128.1 hypothetical protein [Prescottella equi]
MPELHTPDDYCCEQLCSRCGIGAETGRRYVDCANPAWTHEESCAQYIYGDLCTDCLLAVLEEADEETR